MQPVSHRQKTNPPKPPPNTDNANQAQVVVQTVAQPRFRGELALERSVQETQLRKRQANIRVITSEVLKKFVSPLTAWCRIAESHFGNDNTYYLTLELIRPLEQLELSDLKIMLAKYGAAMAFDTINNLDKELVVHRLEADSTEPSFTVHHGVLTIKGESKRIKHSLYSLLDRVDSIEEARSQPYIKQLFKIACDDIQHKFNQRYGPVIAELMEDAGGKVSMRARDNPTVIDLQVALTDEGIRNLSGLLYFRRDNRLEMIDYAAFLNRVLPCLDVDDDEHKWRQTQEPGFNFERVMTKAEYENLYRHDQLRRCLGINFMAKPSIKSKFFGRDHQSYAVAQMTICSISQTNILRHLHPEPVTDVVESVLDEENIDFELEHIGPLAFKLKFEQDESIMSLFENNAEIKALINRYQFIVSESEGDIYFRAGLLLPAEFLAPQAATPAVATVKSPEKECTFSIRDKRDLITQLSKPKYNNFTQQMLSKYIIPLKLTFENQETLKDFKLKFFAAMQQQMLDCNDNPKGFTVQGVKALADDIKAQIVPAALVGPSVADASE